MQKKGVRILAARRLALYKATTSGRWYLVDELLKAGADVNIRVEEEYEEEEEE